MTILYGNYLWLLEILTDLVANSRLNGSCAKNFCNFVGKNFVHVR